MTGQPARPPRSSGGVSALLRYQAVLAWRTLTAMPMLGGLAALAVCASIVTEVVGLEIRFPIAMFLVLSTMAVGMLLTIATTLNGLEAVRWTLPLGSRLVFRSHVVFWLLMASAAGIAMLPFHSPTALAGPAGVADSSPVLLLLSLVLLGGGLASVGAIADGVLRRPSPGRVVVAVVAILWTLNLWVSVLLIAVFKTSDAVLLSMFGIYCLLAVAAASWIFVRTEHSPKGESGDGRVAGTPEVPRGRSTVTGSSSLRSGRSGSGRELPLDFIHFRTSWRPLLSTLFLATAIGYQLFAAMIPSSLWVPQLLMIAGVGNLGTFALAARRWSMASPLSTRRAFRVLMLPVVGVAVAATLVFGLVSVTWLDADAFYQPIPSTNMLRSRHKLLNAVDLRSNIDRQILDSDAALAAYPGLVVRYLRDEFGVIIEESRVRNAMARDWDSRSDRFLGVPVEALDAAMERVRVEISDELVAAHHLGVVTQMVLGLLFTLVVLRMQCGVIGSDASMPKKLAPPLAMVATFLLLYTTDSSPERLVVGLSPWARWASLGACVGLGALLVRSWYRRFARMEWTDLPVVYQGGPWGPG